MTKNDLTALRIIAAHQLGLYGNEVAQLSGGAISKATVYTVLERLVDAGMIREVEEPPIGAMLARTRHFLADAGRKELAAIDVGDASRGA